MHCAASLRSSQLPLFPNTTRHRNQDVPSSAACRQHQAMSLPVYVLVSCTLAQHHVIAISCGTRGCSHHSKAPAPDVDAIRHATPIWQARGARPCCFESFSSTPVEALLWLLLRRRRCILAHCVTPCVGGLQTLRWSCDRPAASKRHAGGMHAAVRHQGGRATTATQSACPFPTSHKLPAHPPVVRLALVMCHCLLQGVRVILMNTGLQANVKVQQTARNLQQLCQVGQAETSWQARVCQACIHIPTHMPNTTAQGDKQVSRMHFCCTQHKCVLGRLPCPRGSQPDALAPYESCILLGGPSRIGA